MAFSQRSVRVRPVFALAALCFSAASAYPFKPWLGNLFEFQLKAAYTYQYYSHIKASPFSIRRPTHDHLANLDLSMTVLPIMSVGIDLGGQKRSFHAMTFDHVRVRGQYLLLDDIIGDPVSATVNLTLVSVDRKALPALGLMHHGRFESTLGLSLGREWAIGRVFTHRLWANAALGGASHASLFTEDNINWQINFIDRLRLGITGFFDGGFGTKKLHMNTFNGYRHERYRVLDIAANLKYRWGIWGDLSFEIGRRLWAENAPDNNLFVRVAYHLPFAAF